MENLIATFHPKHFLEEICPDTNNYHESTCILCEKWISFRHNYFYCRVCDFSFHKECQTILMESNLTIDRPKTHEHTLTFIRKRNSFNCDACGEVRKYQMNMYGCLPCNFFIHKNCMYLPKVIKLTRHSHRLFHTFQVPDCNTRCPLCKHLFVSGCGGYICIECDYKLHSQCATDKKTWDGKDVEGEPEETISNSEIAKYSSLEEVDGETIRHFSHLHDLMRLSVDVEEGGKHGLCQACILPIDFDSFLGCKECDFALHDTCASLPRKLEHTLHRHPLTLEVDMMNIKKGFFRCSQCRRESCSFMYRCCQEECDFKMDAVCASLADPLYKTHKHPLTLFDNEAVCYQCGSSFSLRRAALPALVKCKYDAHPLRLCFLHRSSFLSEPSLRCDSCEIRINLGSHDLYLCTDCNTTLHVECAIGKYPYLKPGHMIKLYGFEIEIASNNSFSRPICHRCHSVCKDKLVFRYKKSVYFCSFNCITSLKKTPL